MADENVGGIFGQLGLDTTQLEAALQAADQRMQATATRVQELMAEFAAGKIGPDELGKALARCATEMGAASKQFEQLNLAQAAAAAATQKVAQAAAESTRSWLAQGVAVQQAAVAAQQAAIDSAHSWMAQGVAAQQAIAAEAALAHAQVDAGLAALMAEQAADAEAMALRNEAAAALAAAAATKVAAKATYDFADAYELVVDQAHDAAVATTTVAKAEAATSTAIRSAGVGTQRFGTIVQQAGYAIGDFASTSGSLGQKLMSVSNNVQFAAASFGPWGVGVGLAVVGVAALVQYWEKAGGAARTFGTAVEELTEKIRKLEEKPTKLAIDYSDLDEAKARLDEIQKGVAEFKSSPKSTDESASGRMAGDLFQDTPGGERGAKDKVQAQIANENDQRSEVIQSALKEEEDSRAKAIEYDAAALKAIDLETASAMQGIAVDYRARAVAARDRARIEAGKIEEAAKAEAGVAFAEAKTGDAGAQARLAQLLRKSGQGGLATQLENSSPEVAKAVRQQKVADDRIADDAERAKETEPIKAGSKEEAAVIHEANVELKRQKDAKDKAAADQVRADRDAEIEGRAELKRQQTENVKTAKEKIPGVEKQAENMVAGAALNGLPIRVVKEQLAAAFEDMGMTKNKAGIAAEAITKDAVQKTQEDVVKEAMGGKEGGGKGMQQFNASEYFGRLQASVAGPDKAIGQRDKMIKQLAEIARGVNGDGGQEIP